MFSSTRILGLSGLILMGGFPASTMIAQEAFAFPRDTKFVLQLDLQTLQETELGGRLIRLIREKIVAEIADAAGSSEGPSLEKISDVLGFDPFEEVLRVTLSAADYEHPERTLSAIVQMKESTGNLEGLMLALPNYDSSKYRDHQVHMASPGHDVTVFAAIHDRPSSGKWIVVSPERSMLEMLLDQMDGRAPSPSDRNAALAYAADATLNLHLLELPAEMMDEGPHTNIMKVLKDVSIQVREADRDLDVVVSIEARNPEQTEQLRQMTQGLLAMVELAKSMEPGDDDWRAFTELVQNLQTQQVGDAVQITVRLNSDKLLEWIEEELD